MNLKSVKIIAVDFDGTLCENSWPEIGEPNEELIEYLRNRKKDGDKLILWTCRVEDMLQKAVEWCKEKFVMIDLHVEGYCQECAGFQPCIERLYADGKIIAQTVYCENRERCANIYEFAHEKVGKEIGKDD